METIQKIRELGFLENVLKVDKVEYSKSKDELSICFLYPENKPLNDKQKKQIADLINTDVNNKCHVVVKFNKSCFDKEIVLSRIEDFVESNYKVLKNEVKPQDIKFINDDNDLVKIVINCDEMRKQVLLNRQFDRELITYLQNKFFYNFEVHFDVTKETLNYQELMQSMPQEDNSLSEILSKEAQINKMEIELGECFYGKYINQKLLFIEDAKSQNEGELFIAGVVSEITENSYNTKPKKSEEVVEKKKISFTLTDPSGSIQITLFPAEKDMHSLSALQEGMELAVGGYLNTFNDNISIRANSLSKCEILTKEIKHLYRDVNKDYLYVKPQPVMETKQMDLFSLAKQETDFWANNKSVVVFDFETTGLDPSSCKIIEIGAVKVVNGSLIETFQTLINPETEIPQEITDITHISQEMVDDAPTIEQVLPDFYKFTYGSVLSAYNIGFDYQFLSNNGQRLRLLFNNQQIDTLKLARDKVPSLSNYKLSTVVKALNITLNNAHRALADAYATAKVFVKLI